MRSATATAPSVGDRSGFRCQVDVHVQHARQHCQSLVHPTDARSTGHGCDVQTNASGTGRIPDLIKGCRNFGNALRCVDLRLGGLVGEIDADIADPGRAVRPRSTRPTQEAQDMFCSES